MKLKKFGLIIALRVSIEMRSRLPWHVWPLLLGSSLAAAPPLPGARWETNGGALTLIGYSGGNDDVKIPASLNGLPVTQIGPYAFQVEGIISVTVPHTVTNIGAYAFKFCTLMRSVTIYDAPTRIGKAAFSDCRSLTNLTIGAGVTAIEESAFAECRKLENIVLGDQVTSIGSNAFGGTSLKGIAIPSSVTDIGMLPFHSCASLTGITVHVQNPNYTDVSGVLLNKSKTLVLDFPQGYQGDFIIPDTVLMLREGQFQNCVAVTNITIGNGVTHISDFAFKGCTNLASVGVGRNVISFGNGAFESCQNLAEVSLPERLADLGRHTFSRCTRLSRITIPNGVMSIGDGTFYSCTSLRTLTMPAGVTSIGDKALSFCTNLTGVYFQGNAPEIHPDAFHLTPRATLYYLPATMGWSTTAAGRPAVLWNPTVHTLDAIHGVSTNGFSFGVTGASNLVVVVEACTNMSQATWFTLMTNTGRASTFTVTDKSWTNSPQRYYRLRSP